jgi:hypothetical protein
VADHVPGVLVGTPLFGGRKWVFSVMGELLNGLCKGILKFEVQASSLVIPLLIYVVFKMSTPA